MKMLVVSDSHMYNDILEHITNKWKNKVDLLVHCGDSSLLPDDPLLGTLTVAEPLILKNVDYNVIFLSNF